MATYPGQNSSSVLEWPGEYPPDGPIRTAIAYKNGEPIAFGSQALTGIRRQSEAYWFFKLSAFSGGLTGPCPGSEGPIINSKKLVVDFLKFAVLPNLKAEYQNKEAEWGLPSWDLAYIDIVMTVPSRYGTNGAKIMVDAARSAGLHTADGRRVICDITLTEGDAAAVASLQEHMDMLEVSHTQKLVQAIRWLISICTERPDCTGL